MSNDDVRSPREARTGILGDEIYTMLGQAIRDGRLTPGQRLRDIELAPRWAFPAPPSAKRFSG